MPFHPHQQQQQQQQQCIIGPEADDFLDLSQFADTPATNASNPVSLFNGLDLEDQQTPAKPTHEYGRYKQQTGLPSGSIAGLGQPSAGPSMFSNTGLDDMMDLGNPTFNFDTAPGSGQMAPFTFGDNSQTIDPHALSQEEIVPVKVWPGMHQQLAEQKQQQLLQQQMMQQQQAHRQMPHQPMIPQHMGQQQMGLRHMGQQQMAQGSQQSKQRMGDNRHASPTNRKNASRPATDALTENAISRVLNQIRQNSQSIPSGSQGDHHNVTTNLPRMKKDEEDMDADERLLASEEGKKLSSKERRQLRNKVSARAFRSRRKEYITQLENEILEKNNEAGLLQEQNAALLRENASYKRVVENILRHPNFAPFLENIGKDPSFLNLDTNASPPLSAHTASPATHLDGSSPRLYEDQKLGNMSQSENLPTNMTTIPEEPMITLDPTAWQGMNPYSFQPDPQIFAVLELPEGPSNPLDTDRLSGKGHSSILDQYESPIEDVKHDFPVIERPAATESVPAAPIQDFSEDDGFDLYHPTNAATTTSSSASPTDNYVSLFGDANPEKVFAHFELFVSDEGENQALMERFERMLAAVEPVCQRIQAITSHLDE